MLSPLFALALLGLSPAPGSALKPNQEQILIIARPESSEYYLPQRQRFTGAELLERNPDLLQTNHPEKGYEFKRALDVGGSLLLQAPAQPVSAVPEPSVVLLLPLTAFLLIRRRRPWHPRE